jgi:stage III sporulation protein AH
LTWDPVPAGGGSAGQGTGGTGTAGTGGSTGAATGGTSGGGETAPASDFFADFRLERERTRGQQLEYLREMINNTKVDEASRKSAADEWLELTKQIGKELELEGLIKAKGWSDCVVFVQAQSCTVVVKADKLTQSDAARVGDIVVRGTGLAPQAISISARTK